jgi:hypothetical protein
MVPKNVDSSALVLTAGYHLTTNSRLQLPAMTLLTGSHESHWPQLPTAIRYIITSGKTEYKTPFPAVPLLLRVYSLSQTFSNGCLHQ